MCKCFEHSRQCGQGNLTHTEVNLAGFELLHIDVGGHRDRRERT